MATSLTETGSAENINTIHSVFYRLQVALGIRPRGYCLITGCPRSGTSAVNAWLGGHYQTAGFVESRILVAAHRFADEVNRFEYLTLGKNDLISMIRRVVFAYYGSKKNLWRKLLIDKEPLEPIAFPDKRYKEFLHNFQLILPEAKLLFIARDPIATIWSMTQRQWGYSLTQKEFKTFNLEEYVANWNACAEIINEYARKKNVYVCRFEKLITDPEKESLRIFDFLSLRYGKIFHPKSTSIPAFSDAEKEFILNETKQHQNMIHSLSNN